MKGRSYSHNLWIWRVIPPEEEKEEEEEEKNANVRGIEIRVIFWCQSKRVFRLCTVKSLIKPPN